MREYLKTYVDGHVLIKDDLGQVYLDKHNAIHPANMATAIARGLAAASDYSIFKMKLGNQGTYIDGTQQIVFRPPNVTSVTVDPTADLYNATYAEIVDDTNAGVGVGNSVNYTNVPASTSTRVIVTCVISANEAINNPTDSSQTTLNPNGTFFFDELGLFTQGTTETTTALLTSAGSLMLSHLIFSPIEHTGNRELTIVYTITITVS